MTMSRIRVALHARNRDSDLRRPLERGFDLATCGGGVTGCGVLHGGSCAATEASDVIVCDGEAGSWRVRRLVAALRARYPHLPIVVAGGSVERDVLESLGEPWVATLVGVPTTSQLLLRIDEALGGTPEAMIGIVG
jgi:hypothetical protein